MRNVDICLASMTEKTIGIRYNKDCKYPHCRFRWPFYSDLGKIFQKTLCSLGKLQRFMVGDHGTSCRERCF